MADDEGGLFPWKMKKLFKLQIAERSRDTLPAPPAGMEWVQDEETREWRLVKAAEDEPELVTDEETRAQKVSPVTPEKILVVDQLPPRSFSRVVDELPLLREGSDHSNRAEEDWEFLSDRVSTGSNGVAVIVQKGGASGSIRSIASMEGAGGGQSHNGSQTTLSVPFKIQRTASSSTIDSADAALGPLGKGILGVDYVEHVVLPADTLQGICLAYKISSTRLRQANHFSGNSLLLAPKKLVIPISKKALRAGYIRVQETDSKEFKLHAFLAEFPDLSMTEAKAYMELADWELKDAVRSAKEDGEWEREMDSCSLRSGEIRIVMNMNKGIPMGFAAQGAGIQPSTKKSAPKKKKETKVTSYEDIPAIATKTVKAQDLVNAAPQHDNFGVEMKPLADRK